MKIEFRDYQPSDLDFITSSWLNFYRRQMQSIPKDVYYYEHQRLIHDILYKKNHVACCSSEHPDLVYGYLIGDHTPAGDIIHFIFVKSIFRKTGIAYEMVKKFREHYNLLYTHDFKFNLSRNNLYKSAKYNPYLFLNGVYHEN